MDKKKIIYFHHSGGIGGGTISLLYLIKKLDRRNFSPKVFFLQDGEAFGLFRENDIEVEVLNKRPHFPHTEGSWLKWWKMYRLPYLFYSWGMIAYHDAPRLLNREKPDLVHLNSTPSLPWGYGAYLLNIPVICGIMEPIPKGYLGVRRSILRMIMRKVVRKFVAISKHNAMRLNIPEKTAVIYNFVDAKIFNKHTPRITHLSKIERKYVLYVGGSTLIKGFGVLAKSLAMLDKNIVVLMAGWYPKNLPLRSKILHPKIFMYLRKIKAAENVEVIGLTTDIPSYISTSDLLIFPSIIPHFARPVIEAHMMAKPVIASNVEGMDELVAHGETGFLIPPNNANALAQAINLLCSDDELAKKMGEEGYRRGANLYNADKNVDQFIEIYRQVLRKNGF